MFDILKKLGKDSVTWDSTFNTGMKLPANAIVHDYQGGNASLKQIAQAGVKVICSAFGPEYVASQKSWTVIFEQELMPTGCVPVCV